MTASNLAIEPVRGSSPSSLDSIPQSMEFNLFKTLDGLINGWCERRALRPLAYLCPLTRESSCTLTNSFSCSKH